MTIHHAKDGIDLQLASQVAYVTPAFLAKNQQLFPDNPEWGVLGDSPVTILMASHDPEVQERVKRLVYYEHFYRSNIEQSDMQVKVVTGPYQVFHAVSGQVTANQTKQVAILVILQPQHMALPDFGTATDHEMEPMEGWHNLINTAYIDRAVLVQGLKRVGLSSKISAIENPSQVAKIESDNLRNQQLGARIGLVALVGIQLLVIYQYTNYSLQLLNKRLVIYRLAGKNSLGLLLQSIGSLVFATSLLMTCLGYYGDLGLAQLLYLLYIIIISASVLVAYLRLKKNQKTYLKGG